ncbi:MAG: amidohydrolase family protein [Acidobacteria bacterium]|nr:amidohydrolase family protein [Acidobacteriota bacterium]
MIHVETEAFCLFLYLPFDFGTVAWRRCVRAGVRIGRTGTAVRQCLPTVADPLRPPVKQTTAKRFGFFTEDVLFVAAGVPNPEGSQWHLCRLRFGSEVGFPATVFEKRTARRGGVAKEVLGKGVRSGVEFGVFQVLAKVHEIAVAKPGSLEDYFRGRNLDGKDMMSMFGDLDPLADHPGYQDHEARVRLLDDQGLEAALLFPTLGVGMQEALKKDLDALHASFRAFNSWLDEDWGFDRDGRLYAAPMITLADPEQAAVEVDRVLAMGARILVMVPGPVPTGTGYLSPGNEIYDPVWARVAESGVPMAIHAGLSGVAQYGKIWEAPTGQFEAFKHSAFPLVALADRSISDTLAAMICHGLLSRFPELKLFSVENGANWVPDLLRNLRDGYGKMPFGFGDEPVEQFKRQIWVSPFYEDDMDLLKELLGDDRLLFGSDFPHAEGLSEPLKFTEDIPNFDADETRKIMRDNARTLLGV